MRGTPGLASYFLLLDHSECCPFRVPGRGLLHQISGEVFGTWKLVFRRSGSKSGDPVALAIAAYVISRKSLTLDPFLSKVKTVDFGVAKEVFVGN